MRQYARRTPGAKKEPITHSGITFGSQPEADRYAELQLLERIGDIRDLAPHPAFPLQPKFTDAWGRKWLAVRYTADSQYVDVKTNRTVIEEVKVTRTRRDGRVVKPTETQVVRLRYHLFQYRYPALYLHVEYRDGRRR